MKIAPGIWSGRGATSYELQIWKIVFRWVHLSGAYWKWKPWRRFSVTLYDDY